MFLFLVRISQAIGGGGACSYFGALLFSVIDCNTVIFICDIVFLCESGSFPL